MFDFRDSNRNCCPPRLAPCGGDLHDIITDWEQLAALSEDWEALWQRAPRDYLLTRPDFAWISRRTPPDGTASSAGLRDRAPRAAGWG